MGTQRSLTTGEMAEKYLDIEKIVSSHYFDEDGGVIEEPDGGDLCDIGEEIVIYFGYF